MESGGSRKATEEDREDGRKSVQISATEPRERTNKLRKETWEIHLRTGNRHHLGGVVKPTDGEVGRATDQRNCSVGKGMQPHGSKPEPANSGGCGVGRHPPRTNPTPQLSQSPAIFQRVEPVPFVPVVMVTPTAKVERRFSQPLASRRQSNYCLGPVISSGLTHSSNCSSSSIPSSVAL